jgi:hypothetical protein
MQEADMNIDRQKLPLARKEITVQVIGEEVMLYDGGSDTIHVLNHSAYAVWNLCNGENTPEDMFQKLSAHYPDAGNKLSDDIQETLRDFRQKLLLVD